MHISTTVRHLVTKLLASNMVKYEMVPHRRFYGHLNYIVTTLS